MNEIKIFNSEEFGILRTVEINGECWFVGKDVAEALGYERPTKAVTDHVDEDDRDEVPIQDSIGRMQKTPVINESGVYSLIFSSKLSKAKKFKHWVTSEVLPTIRRNGAYMTDKTLERALANPDFLIQLATQLKNEKEKRLQLENQVAVQTQQIAELTPKASYYDVVLACTDLLPISQISKDYGWSAQKMNEWLHDKGVQYKQGDIWLLYQNYAEMGYTSTKTHVHTGKDGQPHTKVHTYWTQKGRLFIYELMKKNGYLPKIEEDLK